jgi:hypothetical protein
VEEYDCEMFDGGKDGGGDCDGMQTSKSRFVYCLGPYIAAMISKGKRGAAGMALVLLVRGG